MDSKLTITRERAQQDVAAGARFPGGFAPAARLRWLWIATFVIAAIPFLYIVLANGLLMTGLLKRLVSSDPDAIALDYDGAWTLWFGRVHLKRLALSGSSQSFEWSVVAKDASLDIRLFDLPKKVFRADRIRGRDFSFRMRLRLTTDEADQPRARALPPIPGFADPPLFQFGPPPRPEDDALWTVMLENVDVSVEELWIHHYRYVGDGTTRGGFFMKPKEAVMVMPSSLDLRSGTLTIGEHTIARGIEGQLTCTILPFDPVTVEGPDVFDSVLSTTKLWAQVPGLGFTTFFAPPSSPVRIADGSGATRIDVSLHHGLVLPGSTLDYETDHLEVSAPEIVAKMRGRLALRVPDEPGSSRVEVTTHFPRATLDRRMPGVAPAVFVGTDIEHTVPVLRLADPPKRFSTKADLPAATISDMRWLGPLHPKPDAPRITGGKAHFQGHVEISPEGKGAGVVDARVKGFGIKWKDTLLTGDSTAKVQLDIADLRARELSFAKSHLDLTNVVLTRDKESQKPWWASIDVLHAELAERKLGIAIQARCKDARPALEFLAAGDAMPEWATGLLNTESVTFNARIERKGTRTDINLLRARSLGLDVRGRLKKPDGERAEGAFLIKSGPLSVGIAIDEDGTAVKPFESDAWLDRRIAAFAR